VLVGGLLGAAAAGGELGAIRLGAGALGLGVLLEPPRDEEECEPGPDGALATGVGAGGAFTAGLGVFEGDGAVWGGACC